MALKRDDILKAIQWIGERESRRPKIGVVLGTGHGELVQQLEEANAFPFETIPAFPVSTLSFHAGRLVFGHWAGCEVAVLQGRVHYYEGRLLTSVTIPIRALAGLGVRRLLITAAAGSVSEAIPAESLALISDHVNLAGDNPLIGPYDPLFGERFPDMSEAYSRDLLNRAEGAAADLKVTLPRAVYAGISGPALPTAAEVRMLQILGADVVGMSVVPEVLVARQLGLDVLAMVMVTDLSTPEHAAQVDPQTVRRITGELRPIAGAILKNILESTCRE
jgi:purine-nucleoside phosphorylase